MRNLLLSLLCFINAYEHIFSIGPSLSYMNWQEAVITQSGQWSAGSQQVAVQSGWYTMLNDTIFTGMHGIYTTKATLTFGDSKYSAGISELAAIAGLRYRYDVYETRFWWGLAYVDVDTNLPMLDASNILTPVWGVSYGFQPIQEELSWHWGLILTPGRYNYVNMPYTQIPNNAAFFVSCEWHVV